MGRMLRIIPRKVVLLCEVSWACTDIPSPVHDNTSPPARLQSDDWYLPPQAPFFLHYLLVLFPIGKSHLLLSAGHPALKPGLLATGFAFLTLISLVPSLFSRRHAFPPALYLGFAIPSTITSTLAFAFAMAEFSIGYSHFNDQLNRGNNKYGPAVRS